MPITIKNNPEALKVITINVGQTILNKIQFYVDEGHCASRSEYIRQSLIIGMVYHEEVLARCKKVVYGRPIVSRTRGATSEQYPHGQKLPPYMGRKEKRELNQNGVIKIGDQYFQVLRKLDKNPNGEEVLNHE